MNLKQALFAHPDVSIYQVDSDEYETDGEPDDVDDSSENDFLYWKVTPIYAPTLAAESARDRILDGHFILKAVFVSPSGELQDCYVSVSMPERISETAYFYEGDHIRQGWKDELKGKVVPLVAIEGFGSYELFYSRSKPEIGLDVLRKGLDVAKNRADIAQDMAYILRDEKRYEESVEAFTIAIEENEAKGAGNEHHYFERAALREKLGDAAGALADHERAAAIAKRSLR